jgi:hypothetical protein
MTTSASRKPQLSRLPLPKSDIALLKLSVIALLLCTWTLLVLARHWPKSVGSITFAVTVLFAPTIFCLSIWEIFRYKATWRGFLAVFFSAAAVALWALAAFEIIKHAAGT